MSKCCSKKKWSKIWGETYKLLRIREHQRTHANVIGCFACLFAGSVLSRDEAGKGPGERRELCSGVCRRARTPRAQLWGGSVLADVGRWAKEQHQEDPVFVQNWNLFSLLSPVYSTFIWISPTCLGMKKQFLFVVHKSLYELSQSEQKLMISLVLQCLRQIVYPSTLSHIWYPLKNRE